MKWSHSTGDKSTECAPAAVCNSGRAQGRLTRLARIFTAARAADGRPYLIPICTEITRAQFACGTRVGLRCGQLWILF